MTFPRNDLIEGEHGGFRPSCSVALPIAGYRMVKHPRDTDASQSDRRKERIWRTAREFVPWVPFQGNMLTSAFGASIAASIATAYGCDGMSSGRISTGVSHLRTKSRVTVKTKSGWSGTCSVRKPVDRLHRDLGLALGRSRAPTPHVVVVERSRISGRDAARLREHRRDNTVGRAFEEVAR